MGCFTLKDNIMTRSRANQLEMQLRENKVLACIQSYQPVSVYQLTKLTHLTYSIISKHVRVLKDEVQIGVQNPHKKPPLYQCLPAASEVLADIPKEPTKISIGLTEEFTQYCQNIRINKFALMEEVLQNYLTTKSIKPKKKFVPIPPETLWVKIKNFFTF